MIIILHVWRAARGKGGGMGVDVGSCWRFSCPYFFVMGGMQGSDL